MDEVEKRGLFAHPSIPFQSMEIELWTQRNEVTFFMTTNDGQSRFFTQNVSLHLFFHFSNIHFSTKLHFDFYRI